MRLAPFFMILPAILLGQPGKPGAAAPETKPEDRCVLEGKVVSAATGEPVQKANILLRRVDQTPATGGLPNTYSTSSDAGGKFAMKISSRASTGSLSCATASSRANTDPAAPCAPAPLFRSIPESKCRI